MKLYLIIVCALVTANLIAGTWKYLWWRAGVVRRNRLLEKLQKEREEELAKEGTIERVPTIVGPDGRRPRRARRRRPGQRRNGR